MVSLKEGLPHWDSTRGEQAVLGKVVESFPVLYQSYIISSSYFYIQFYQLGYPC
jgi:hypothetical protein